MVDYFRLQERKSSFLDRLDEALRDADETRPADHRAATTIQRLYRGVVWRVIITKKHYAANEIQRCFRGHCGRVETHRRRREKRDWIRASYLHFLVIQLQRCFRGYHSRKYKQDHAQRKQYCRMIEEKGRAALHNMQQFFHEQAEQLAEEARQKREEGFKGLAKNLHHLLSTQQIRGVYNPLLHFVEKPTMNQLPVEEHIRAVVKDLLRTRGIAKRSSTMQTDLNNIPQVPLKGQKYRLSLQASAAYDTVQQAERREKHLHRLKLAEIANKDFLAGGRTQLLEKTAAKPMAVGEPYLDPWANPMLVKGVPQNQQQLLESARTHKALFAPPITGQPFKTRVGGNHSAALPNDIFDVIAEAQTTGGAVQRHLGTRTRRFGLPDNADARYSDDADPYNITAAGTTNNGAAPGATTAGAVAAGATGMFSSSTRPSAASTVKVTPHDNIIAKAPLRTSATMRSTTRRVRNYSDTGRHLAGRSAAQQGATSPFGANHEGFGLGHDDLDLSPYAKAGRRDDFSSDDEDDGGLGIGGLDEQFGRRRVESPLTEAD